MGAPNPLDFVGINGVLSTEERMVRDEVRNFVKKEFLPLIEDAFEEARFPFELVPKLAEMGLLGMKFEGYGCPGGSNVMYGLACQELEKGDSGLRSFVSVHTSLAMYPIYTFGSEEQKNRWLPDMAAGKKIGCFGLTEPDSGSNPAGMNTWAEKKDGDWVVTGNKLWITNGSVADVAVVWARTDDGVRGFVLEKGMKGFSAHDIKKKLSLRASVTSELVLDNVRVPEENVLPNVKGLKGPLMCLNEARFGIAWGAMGAALDCYERALNYAKKRTQFGKPIAGFQLTQQKLVEMMTEITKGQLLALHVGRLKDQGKADHRHISLIKRNNVSEALKICRDARGILGANGITLDHTIMRHMCNLESVYTYEGTHEVHTLILGDAITGLNAFS